MATLNKSATNNVWRYTKMFGNGGYINANQGPLYAETWDTRTPEQVQVTNALSQMILKNLTSGASTYQGQFASPITDAEQQLLGSVGTSYADLLAKSKAATELGINEDYYKTNIEDPVMRAFREQAMPTIANQYSDTFESSSRANAINRASKEATDTLTAARAQLAKEQEDRLTERLNSYIGAITAGTSVEELLRIPRSIEDTNLQGQYNEYVRGQEQATTAAESLLGQKFLQERTPIHPDYYREDPEKFLNYSATLETLAQRQREAELQASTANRQTDVQQLLGLLGLQTTERGQDISAGTSIATTKMTLEAQAKHYAASMGLDYAKLSATEQYQVKQLAQAKAIAEMNAAVTTRGQNLTAATATAGQASTAKTASNTLSSLNAYRESLLKQKQQAQELASAKLLNDIYQAQEDRNASLQRSYVSAGGNLLGNMMLSSQLTTALSNKDTSKGLTELINRVINQSSALQTSSGDYQTFINTLRKQYGK